MLLAIAINSGACLKAVESDISQPLPNSGLLEDAMARETELGRSTLRWLRICNSVTLSHKAWTGSSQFLYNLRLGLFL